jgi:hypothetical protein
MELRRTGLVTFHNKRLVIHDVRALQAAAGFNDRYLHLGAVEPTVLSRPAGLAPVA